MDFGRVLGKNGTVYLTNTTADYTTKPLIIIGTIGSSPNLIDKLVSSGKIDVSKTKGQWEAYISTLVDSPLPGISSALVIAGADRRGVIFGVYDMSEQIGVSPYWWWTDVPSKKQTAVYAKNMTKVQPSPSVKYRGIFVNNEAPALRNWIDANYPPLPTGPGFGAPFWTKVFEMLLRMKANYLWPTTWDSEFYIDDKNNAITADLYGIVMGTSHTEPMTRQSKEQETILKGGWDWIDNKGAIKDFMKEGVTRTKTWDTLYTLGMRGLGDVASPTSNETVEEEIVDWQRSTLSDVLEKPITDIQQTMVLFDELGSYYQYGMQLPEDIPLIFPDDNAGRGFGIYYHIDMNAPPRCYKWINTIQNIKTWHQLKLGYEKNASKIWMVNVGDIKPLEIPTAHIMAMAYDITQFQTVESTSEWMMKWAARQFGPSVANVTNAILTEYGRLIIRRKYEQLSTTPFAFDVVNYDEAESSLNDWLNLVPITQAAYDSLDPVTATAFFEIVLHPVLAGSIVENLYEKYTRNQLYAKQKRTSTNVMGLQVLSLFAQDAAITQRFHTILNGKWNHMMDQPHIGYTTWSNPAGNIMPNPTWISGTGSANPLGISVQGKQDGFTGNVTIDSISMDPYMPPTEKRWFEIYTLQNTTLTYTIKSSLPYVTVSSKQGELISPGTKSDARVFVNVDWKAAPAGVITADLSITTNKNSLVAHVRIPINKTMIATGFKGHVASNGYVSIEAEHYVRSKSVSTGTWQHIPTYGRTLSGMHILPFTGPSQTVASAPSLEYDFYTFSTTTATSITVYIGPTMNVDQTRPIRYGISIDGKTTTVVKPVLDYVLGPPGSNWQNAIEGIWTTKTSLGTLSEGKHTLSVTALEPNLVFEKFVIDVGGLKRSYLGPPESYRA